MSCFLTIHLLEWFRDCTGLNVKLPYKIVDFFLTSFSSDFLFAKNFSDTTWDLLLVILGLVGTTTVVNVVVVVVVFIALPEPLKIILDLICHKPLTPLHFSLPAQFRLWLNTETVVLTFSLVTSCLLSKPLFRLLELKHYDSKFIHLFYLSITF